MLVDEGADFLGFPLRLNDGREDLDEKSARAIIGELPAHVSGVVITYLEEADEILDLMESTGADWIQLHGPCTTRALARIRRNRPALKIIKSLIIRQQNQPKLEQEIEKFTPWVNAFLTDTHDPGTRRTGATGITHDWLISGKVAERSPRPVILAGGLDHSNVAEAIRTVKPTAVDAHSRLEGEDGRKDRQRVSRFIAQARKAWRMV